MINPIEFPLTNGEQVGSTYEGPNGELLEPSGLVVLNETLYMASDNGYLMGMDVSPGASMNQPWAKVHNFTNDDYYEEDKDRYDLESITAVTGKLMIGVEGDSSYKPRILRYNISYNDPTGSIWKISDAPNLSGGGMEAMTFVPLSACPNFGGNPYYGGYFFAAYQGNPGYVYVYDLPKGNRESHIVDNYVTCFSISSPMEASDLCFANGYLFILFDGDPNDNHAKDELRLYSIQSKESNGLQHVATSELPSLPTWDKQTDFEGIAIDGSDMYLAVDDGGSNPHKLVWRYTDYNITYFI